MDESKFKNTNKRILSHVLKGGDFGCFLGVTKPALDNLYVRALTQYEKGNYLEALNNFRTLCYFDHWNPKYFVGLGSCQKLLGLYANAIDSFSYAARQDLLNPICFVHIGDCYNLLKNKEKTRNAYKAAVVFAKELGLTDPEYSRAENALKDKE